MAYIRTNSVKLVGNIGVNPIFYHEGLYYVGIETLNGTEEEIENCIEASSIEEALDIVKNVIGVQGACFEPVKEETL